MFRQQQPLSLFDVILPASTSAAAPVRYIGIFDLKLISPIQTY
jgi:hypothetical protein